MKIQDFSPWESYGMNLPGGYHKSNETRDWEKPAQIHQGQLMLEKPVHLL